MMIVEIQRGTYNLSLEYVALVSVTVCDTCGGSIFGSLTFCFFSVVGVEENLNLFPVEFPIVACIAV